jgi:hypothetical protein
MRRTWIVVAAVLLFLGGTGFLSGCAKKAQEDALTTMDSTLAFGDTASDVPPPGPMPGEEYAPPAQETPPPAAPTPRPKSRAPAPGAPAPSKPAAPATITLPAGTAIALDMSTPLTTKTATAGQQFTATVAEDVVMDGQVVVPAGAEVTGHVALAQRSGKASGRAYMQLAYDDLSFGGKTYNVASVGDTVWGKGGGSKDAKMIGGGAAAGAVIGGILGGSAGSAVKGAVIGGAAGTGASLLTRGPDLEIKAGQKVTLSLDQPVAVPKPKAGT